METKRVLRAHHVKTTDDDGAVIELDPSARPRAVPRQNGGKMEHMALCGAVIEVGSQSDQGSQFRPNSQNFATLKLCPFLCDRLADT